MLMEGNIVSERLCGYGKLSVEGSRIGTIEFSGDVDPAAEWILPGFIDVHLHGIYDGNSTVAGVAKMIEAAPMAGITTICPTMATDTTENMCAFLAEVKELTLSPPANGARPAGSHLEGPYMERIHRGGMNPRLIRMPDAEETAEFLRAADGTLKIMTIAPELPGAYDVIALLKKHRVAVSAGHTGMKAADVPRFVAAGGDAVCHLFDAFDGRTTEGGVPEVCLTDKVIVEDSLLLELIPDGVHVPPDLVKLAVRAAGTSRIVAITDSLQGAGLPDGEYHMTDYDRIFRLVNGDACRLTDPPGALVGSCLTMNRAFFNFCEKFGFHPVQASQMTSANAAKYLRLPETGVLKPGMAADIAVLAPDRLTVRRTIVGGREVWSSAG